MNLFLMLRLKIHYHTDFFLCYFLEFYSFTFYIQVYGPFLQIVLKEVRPVSRLFFGIWISSCSSIICREDYAFSIELPLHLCLGPFLGSLFCSIGLHMSIVSQIPHCLDYCRFTENLKVR